MDIIAQTGKRWSESKDHIPGTNQSYIFALHGKTPSIGVLSLFLGSSLVLDHYKLEDQCEKMSCLTISNYKVGVDFGTEFTFPIITVFLEGRVLAFSRGRHRVSGKTKLRFPKSLSTFENGINTGELYNRSLGFDITGGMKWKLVDALSLLLSFEMAYERIRTESGGLKIHNEKGDVLHLSSSLKTDWISNNSSAIYIGLAYTL